MVRGWLYLKDFGHLTDLDFDRRFRDNKKCDYAIQHSDEYIELIECKRLRPDRTTNEDQSMSAAKKIIRKLGSVVEQFEGAAKVLGDSVQNNLLMVDISEYNKTGQQYGSGKKSIRLIGFQDNEIEQIVSILLTSSNEHSRVPDRITICWNVIVEIDGVFAAIVQRSRTLCFDKRILMKFEYSGWTAEAYSIASSGSGNIRVASQAFSVDRIITTFNMARDPGAFAKAGKPVTP